MNEIEPLRITNKAEQRKLELVPNKSRGRSARVLLTVEDFAGWGYDLQLSPIAVGRMIDWLQRWQEETQAKGK